MKKFRSLINWVANQPIHLRILMTLFVGLTVVLISVAANETPPAPEPGTQPIAFNHKIMVANGISCVFCHSGVTRSETATMPSTETCMGCHKSIDPTNPEIIKLTAYYTSGKPIPWVRMITLPRFVHFSHQVHVVAGAQNCENCHGDVSQMTDYKPPYNFNMGTCLECHNKQPNAQQINSCETCHK
jgi:hypothetical protein